MHGSVGGSGQRLASSLVGGGTQRKPLKVDLRCHKTGYTEGTMLFRSVRGIATYPRVCCILRRFGTRCGPTARIPDRLSSPLVSNPRASYVLGHLPSSSSSPGISQACSAGWGGRPPNGRAREARSPVCVPECNTFCAFQHAMSVYPASMVARYLHRCGHAPDPHMGHLGLVLSKSMARPPPLVPVCFVVTVRHLVRSPRHLPPAARPPKAALGGAVAHRPH